MKISAGFAMIVLCTAGLATAEPKQEETSGRVSLGADAQASKKPSANAPRASSDWVELADASPAKHGTVYAVVGRDAGYFGKLRIDAAKGTVVVKNVKVFFDDGKAKVYKVDKALNAKNRKFAIVELGDARAIDRIAVTTERKGGEYTVSGSASGGIVAGR